VTSRRARRRTFTPAELVAESLAAAEVEEFTVGKLSTDEQVSLAIAGDAETAESMHAKALRAMLGVSRNPFVQARPLSGRALRRAQRNRAQRLERDRVIRAAAALTAQRAYQERLKAHPEALSNARSRRAESDARAGRRLARTEASMGLVLVAPAGTGAKHIREARARLAIQRERDLDRLLGVTPDPETVALENAARAKQNA
jgi:hypothetical protein